MVRKTAVLAIVLALHVMQSAPGLCLTWCDPPPPAVSACHESAGLPSLSAHDHCADVTQGLAAFVPEGQWRGAAAPSSAQAVVRSRDVRPSADAASLDIGRPLISPPVFLTPLRI